MTTAELERMSAEERVHWRLANDTPYFARNCLKIVDKNGLLVPLIPNAAQLGFEDAIKPQIDAGEPVRVIVLKARQIGCSTWAQAKAIQRAVFRQNHKAVVVAHDKFTASSLFGMGQRMYANLPEEVKPPLRHHQRGQFLHFAEPGRNAWMAGDAGLDSEYWVDTASEFQAGRGRTYQFVHASEAAFWGQPLEKLTALRSAVPRTPDTMFIIESTAKGYNAFRDEWVRAEQGESAYIPFFWPWWKDISYRIRFGSEHERKRFRVGEGPYGDREPELVERYGLEPEQLLWRRQMIADECGGRIETFNVEYPTTPDDAFIASGSRVFDGELLRGILVSCDISDPLTSDALNPGPLRGAIEPGGTQERTVRTGKIEVPIDPKWNEDPRLTAWRLWTPFSYEDPAEQAEFDQRQFVIGVDVSGGELAAGHTDTAYQAIQVVDHETREQVAEYRSRVDQTLLAVEVYLAALAYNRAWVAPEITGGWGIPVVHKLWLEFRYPFLYTRRNPESRKEKTDDRLGWDTNRKTRPLMEAGFAEMLREGTHGIKSRLLVGEAMTYVRDEVGRTGPEHGKFSDLLMAYMIAQQIADELPVRGRKKSHRRRPLNPRTGY